MIAQRTEVRRRLRSASGGLLALVLGALAGCAPCASIDDFHIKKLNFDVFREPDNPVQVVQTSKDGNERARALLCLREPLARGGTQQEQDVVVGLLVHSAANETQPWCRSCAISSLRHFKDPRAAEGLKDAYYRANTFAPQTAAALRSQALAALGETANPVALDLILRVLKEPPVEGPDQDRQQKREERIVAMRALAHFKHYQATTALVDVLRTEKDPEMRTPAHEALMAATGKNLPPDAQAWADLLQNPNSPAARAAEPGPIDKVMRLVGAGS